MARRCKHLWPALGALALLAAQAAQPPRAHAYAEQASLDAASGYLRVVDAAPLPAHGATLDLGAGYGIGESVVLRGALGYARLREGALRAHAGRARLEGLYLIDVLRAVPFVGAGASLTVAAPRTGDAALHPGAHLLVGIDYLWSRTFVLGLDVRTGILLADGSVRSATEVAVRLSRMFELF